MYEDCQTRNGASIKGDGDPFPTNTIQKIDHSI